MSQQIYGDEEYLTKHDNNHNNSNYPNTHFFSERNIRKSEKESHKKNKKTIRTELKKNRERVKNEKKKMGKKNKKIKATM